MFEQVNQLDESFIFCRVITKSDFVIIGCTKTTFEANLYSIILERIKKNNPKKSTF